MISRSNIVFIKFAKELFPEIPMIVSISYGGDIVLKKSILDVIKTKHERLKKVLIQLLQKI